MNTNTSKEIETERLLLRQWRDEDKPAFYQMSADPEVMQYFGELYSRERSDAVVDKAARFIAQNGWGFWACEIKQTSEFIGLVGLNGPDVNLPFPPATEIGWRLAKQYWGYGYATEAAKASLEFAFEQLKLEQLVSFAVKSNLPSIAVMERIGMQNTCDDFEHPKVSEPHLKQHVLYRISRLQYQAMG